MTDSDGTVTDTYDYYAFGEELSRTGTTPNSFRYVGEQYDPNCGFYYLRARWMDPALGRFVSVDPWSGDPQSPMSLHRYLYANASPLSHIDPSGKFSTIQILITGAIIGGVVGGSVGVYIAKTKGYKITEEEFWYWVGGGVIAGATVGSICTWALIKFGLISTATTAVA